MGDGYCVFYIVYLFSFSMSPSILDSSCTVVILISMELEVFSSYSLKPDVVLLNVPTVFDSVISHRFVVVIGLMIQYVSRLGSFSGIHQ